MQPWKRAIIITVGSLLGLLVVSYAVYLVFEDRITQNIRAAIINYARTRVADASEGAVRVDIGDISYTYLTGTLNVTDVRVTYGSTAPTRMSVHVPSFSVEGLFPWDILDGEGLRIGMVTVRSPQVELDRTKLDTARPEPSAADTSLVRLPRVPDADSVVRDLFMNIVPRNVQPLSIGGIEIVDGTLLTNGADSASTYAGAIRGIDLQIGTISVDASNAHVRPIAHVDLRVREWQRRHNDGRLIATHGLHLRIDDIDSTMSVDSIGYHAVSGYRLHASGVRFSYRTRELSITRFAIAPSGTDEAFFARHRYNVDRFRISGGPVVLRNMDFSALEDRTAFHVGVIDVDALDLDILSNRRLRPDPSTQRPQMLNTIARTLPFRLAVDSVRTRRTTITYGERWPNSSLPATLRWTDVRTTITGLQNANAAQAPFTLHARGTFQGQSTMEATFVIPLTSSVYTLDARGSLGRFDVTSLNSFLPIAENVRIRSGVATLATFAYSVRGRACTGTVSPHFTNLRIDLVNKKTKKKGGFLNVLVSFVANWIVVKNDNDGEDFEDGVIRYTLPADAAIMQTIWFPVREGLTKAAGL